MENRIRTVVESLRVMNTEKKKSIIFIICSILLVAMMVFQYFKWTQYGEYTNTHFAMSFFIDIIFVGLIYAILTSCLNAKK